MVVERLDWSMVAEAMSLLSEEIYIILIWYYYLIDLYIVVINWFHQYFDGFEKL